MKADKQAIQPKVHHLENMEEKADLQEREIESIRGNLGQLLGELDRRRHRLAPRVLIRAHPVTTAALGIAALALVGGRRKGGRILMAVSTVIATMAARQLVRRYLAT